MNRYALLLKSDQESALVLLAAVTCSAAGMVAMTSVQFVRFWMNGHGYKLVPDAQTPTDGPMCRRIEWEYL